MFYYWRVYFGITSLLCILLSIQDQYVFGWPTLYTTCPQDYIHNEEVQVRCMHNPGTKFLVVRAKCTGSSLGLQVFNGTEILGSNNCYTVNGSGLTDCPNDALTKDGSKYPRCSCVFHNPSRFEYQVTFKVNKMYHRGNSFKCNLDCQKEIGGRLQVDNDTTGKCNDIVVRCNRTTYGPTCNSTCGQCEYFSACNSTTGVCRACQPGFEMPLCQTCSPLSTGSKCSQCKKEGFQPFNCTECKPGVMPPACTRCTNPGFVFPNCTECKPGVMPPACTRCTDPGFVFPNCTECKPGLLFPNCTSCINPGFKPLDCVECLPGFEAPNCTKIANETSVRPPENSGLTTAQTVGVVGGAVAGSSVLAGVGAYALDARRTLQSICGGVETAQYVVDVAAEAALEGGEDEEEDGDKEDGDKENTDDSP